MAWVFSVFSATNHMVTTWIFSAAKFFKKGSTSYTAWTISNFGGEMDFLGVHDHTGIVARAVHFES